jgi:hypothetical protein
MQLTDVRARSEADAIAYVAEDVADWLDEIADVIWQLIRDMPPTPAFAAGVEAFTTAAELRNTLRRRASSYRVERIWDE